MLDVKDSLEIKTNRLKTYFVEKSPFQKSEKVSFSHTIVRIIFSILTCVHRSMKRGFLDPDPEMKQLSALIEAKDTQISDENR